MLNNTDYYDVKRVSASSLSWFEHSPYYFRSMIDKEIDEETKHYYVEGDKIHKFILEPDNYKYTVLDYDTPVSKQKQFLDKIANYKKSKLTDDKILKAYKEIYVAKGKDNELLSKANQLITKYKNYIHYHRIKHIYDFIWSTSENQYMENLKSQIYNHKAARNLLQHISSNELGNVVEMNEYEIYWVHDTGIECKSKLDRLIIDYTNKSAYIIDLKTTSSLHDFDKHSFIKFKYYRQMAFYRQALKWFLNESDYNANEFNIDPLTIKYLNRLSDFLFVLARKFAVELGGEEIKWKPRV